MTRYISSLLMPVIILGLSYFLYPVIKSLPDNLFIAVQVLPFLLTLVLLMLCLRFNRSRLFFASLNLLLLYMLLNWTMTRSGTNLQSLVYPLLSLFAPFNFMVFSELKERGVFTLWGSTRFMLLLIPFVVSWGVIQFNPEWLASMLHYRFISYEPIRGTTFTQSAQLLILATILIMGGRLMIQPDAQRGALYGSLFAVLVSLHFMSSPVVNSLLANAVLLMFIIALIQESWSMAYIDHLTDLPGRRALNEQLLKLSGTYSIAMLDIDHFKKFNDKYGHDAGDEVLRMVAARIRNVGAGGKVYRYGGEEFTVVFPSKSMEDVIDNLEAIRERVAGSPFYPTRKERRKTIKTKKSGKDRGVKVTISIGIAAHSDRQSLPQDVIKAADKALYRAKKKGRNCVVK